MWQDRSKRFGNWLAYPIQSQPFYQLFLFCMIRRHACMRSACYWKFHNVQQNKYPAKASGKALRRCLEKNGAINDYKNVLMKEYQDLNAIEKDDQPQKGGYYMLHHAVIREAASTPKSGLFLTHHRQKNESCPWMTCLTPGHPSYQTYRDCCYNFVIINVQFRQTFEKLSSLKQFDLKTASFWDWFGWIKTMMCRCGAWRNCHLELIPGRLF